MRSRLRIIIDGVVGTETQLPSASNDDGQDGICYYCYGSTLGSVKAWSFWRSLGAAFGQGGKLASRFPVPVLLERYGKGLKRSTLLFFPMSTISDKELVKGMLLC